MQKTVPKRLTRYHPILLGIIVIVLLVPFMEFEESVESDAAGGVVTDIRPRVGLVEGQGLLTITGTDFGYGQYVPVAYLEFVNSSVDNSSPVINTGINNASGISVSATYQIQSTATQWIWAIIPAGNTEPQCGLYSIYDKYSSTEQQLNQAVPGATFTMNPATIGTPVTIVSSAGTSCAGGIQIGVAESSIGFASRLKAFSITRSGSTVYNGVPVYDTATNAYGLYNTVTGTFTTSATGVLSGPTPHLMTVTLSGKNTDGTTVSKPCTDVTVISPTNATCVIPETMFDDDGSGDATVTITWTDQTATVQTNTAFKFQYQPDPMTVDSVFPDSGPVHGGDVLTIKGTSMGARSFIPVPYLQFVQDEGTWYHPSINTRIPFQLTTQVTVTYTPGPASLTNGQTIWGGGSARLYSHVTTTNLLREELITQSYDYAFTGNTNSTVILGSVSDYVTPVTVVSGRDSAQMNGGTPINTPVQGGSSSIIVGGNNAGYFDGRIYTFQIQDSATLADPPITIFNGVPVYNVTTGTYGLYDSITGGFFGNASVSDAANTPAGVIQGPDGPGASERMSVTFTGQNSAGMQVSAACSSVTVVDSMTTTCVVPPSMLGGNGAGDATVSVAWRRRDGTSMVSQDFTYTYVGPPVSVTSISPDKGLMVGGTPCSVTGTQFVTMLDGLSLDGLLVDDGGTGDLPAAWTESDQTVYGWYDPTTGTLTKHPQSDSMIGYLDGQTYDVPITQLLFGDQPATGVTVTSVSDLTCAAIPAHSPGVYTISVNVDGKTADQPLVDGFQFFPVGDLEVQKTGWICPADHRDKESIDQRLCTLLPSGGTLVAGTIVTWAYTVTYVVLDEDGQPIITGTPVLTTAHVTDDKLGPACDIGPLSINEPAMCVASGEVTV
ncbi:MAG: IPT/TIG domain-containing protein [Propionibacteriaceae bacterium]|nr:IPT/TIG domain-containing protein [Propionibacteriaceae bacterium]